MNACVYALHCTTYIACMYAYMLAYIRAYLHACMHACVRACVHACMHACINVWASHFVRLLPHIRASHFRRLCLSGPACSAAPFHQLLRYSLLVFLCGHAAFDTHVPKPSRLPTRSPRSKTRRFVYARPQCASPRSFRPSQTKPPGRLDPTKSNTLSLKVTGIPIKTRLRSLCQAFPLFSRASPLDAHSDSDRLSCHAQLFPTSAKCIIY